MAASKNTPSTKPKASSRAPRSSRSPSSRPGAREPRRSAFRDAARKRPTLTWGAAALGGTIALAAITLLFGYGSAHPTTGSNVEVDWPAGLDSVGAAKKLEELGLVDDAGTMAIFLRATGGVADFVAGPHLLFRGATPWDLRRMLSRSLLRGSAKVTFPEGFTRFDMGARLEKLHIVGRASFLTATGDQALLAELGIKGKDGPAESAEGYLFPATYSFDLDSEPRDVVRKLVAELEKRWSNAAGAKTTLDGLAGSLGFTRYELLTLASLVEKEAVMDDERPIIASVFLNRLSDPKFTPKKLQSDPSSSYGCLSMAAEIPACSEFKGKPTHAINLDPKNRWSTYVREGLPPGPIANAGIKSIEAALAPMTTRFFYFVAVGGGRHAFSETLEQHNAAVHNTKAP
jgi:UPF0755 protein